MPDPVTIRRATPADVPAVVALVESAYRGDGSRAGWTTEADLLDGQRTDAGSVAAAVASARSCILVAVGEDDAILACCELEDYGSATAHFGMFAVRPDRQGAGLGRLLLGAAEQEARTAYGAVTLEMTVIAQRAELIDWYERRGYRRTGETRPFPYGDDRFGLPRRVDLHFVVLEKPLGQAMST
jgi:ribosomal protein S18 acetylase RimI-like enzyme